MTTSMETKDGIFWMAIASIGHKRSRECYARTEARAVGFALKHLGEVLAK